MKAVGIVAEYNPLHNGHVYHIDQSRSLSGADAVVVAMSGDYVQRGEPAILDKWTRAGHALMCGADLVVEIPALFCLGNAGQYAAAAAGILEATGKLTHLSFGSECGDARILSLIAKTMKEHDEELACEISSMRGTGLSYPAARELAYAALRGRITGLDPSSDPQIKRELDVLKGSNDLLAVEYIRALDRACPLAVKRAGLGYSDPYDEKIAYQSASALRTRLFEGHDISRYVPGCCFDDLESVHITGPDHDRWWDTLRYAVMTMPAESIEDCPSGGEGLARLMKAAVSGAGAYSWTSYIRRIKSKRYTYTRLSRLCMQTLLRISRDRYDCAGPEYIRVLGFSDTGRRLLSEIRKEESSSLPVITNINKGSELLSDEGRRLLELDILAADIYNLITGRDVDACSDHRRMPVMI